MILVFYNPPGWCCDSSPSFLAVLYWFYIDCIGTPWYDTELRWLLGLLIPKKLITLTSSPSMQCHVIDCIWIMVCPLHELQILLLQMTEISIEQTSLLLHGMHFSALFSLCKTVLYMVFWSHTDLGQGHHYTTLLWKNIFHIEVISWFSRCMETICYLRTMIRLYYEKYLFCFGRYVIYALNIMRSKDAIFCLRDNLVLCVI
jgi:hypothetical protein